jgi:class 3 adenylate cyclase
LEALNKHASSLISVNPDSAYKISTFLLEYATSKGLRKYQGKAYHLYGRIYSEKNDVLRVLKYYNLALKIFEDIDFEDGISNELWQLGLTHYYMGENAKAVELYSRTLDIEMEMKDTMGISGMLTNIGIIYQLEGDYETAINYYTQACEIIEKKEGINNVALNRIGEIYIKQKKYDQAQIFFENRLKQIQEGKLGIYYDFVVTNCSILNGLAEVHTKMGNFAKAEDYYMKSHAIATEHSSNYMIGNSEQLIGSHFLQVDQPQKSIEWCTKALTRAKQDYVISLSKQMQACECLYKAYKKLDQHSKALFYHEEYKALFDSLKIEEVAKGLQKMEFSKQLIIDSIQKDKERTDLILSHNSEISRKNKFQNILIGSGFILLFVVLGLIWKRRNDRKNQKRLEKEKKRSDELLLNILPAHIAEELKTTGKSLAKAQNQVSILFTDFVGFTSITEKLEADQLVQQINYYFRAFDEICNKYHVEKIKTIGDAYMAVSNVSSSGANATKNIVLAALEMSTFVENIKKANPPLFEYCYDMRAGIHTGSVIAGIVGASKFQYDIWGDAVNIASRMESAGVVGRVNISKSTYDIIKDDPDLTFEARGKVEAKGKGSLYMWLVKHSSSSENNTG